MKSDHPITPSPELVQDWAQKAQLLAGDDPVAFAELLCNTAARWGADHQLKLDTEQINQAWQKGADQELEACCEWVSQWCGRWPDGTRPEDALRAARRPKPPSLKALALADLDTLVGRGRSSDTIRRALEQLDD